jgi:hypothetical protein
MRSITSAAVLSLTLVALSCGGAVVGANGVGEEMDPLTSLGSHPNFVFVLGALNTSSHSNWVWIGTYALEPSKGRIRSTHWRWDQQVRVSREDTGVTTCLAQYSCPVRTAGGYLSAPMVYNGSYQVSGDEMSIHWDDGRHQKWMIQQTTRTSVASGKIIRIESVVADDLGANYGWGYGSKASLSASKRLSDLVEWNRYTLAFHYSWRIWKTNGAPTAHIDVGHDHPYELGPSSGWTRCPNNTTARCLARVTEQTACGSIDQRWNQSIVDLAGADRRNVREYWCKHNAEARGETCYTGNSHVNPFMQILDDDGEFRGWVGVEASLGQGSAGSWSDDQIGVEEIVDPRLTFQ